MLSGKGNHAEIVDFSGRGDLRGWVARLGMTARLCSEQRVPRRSSAFASACRDD
jgi:hypothetical protein